MTDIADLSLGLPADIEADVAAIQAGADDLDQLRQTMLGDAKTADTSFRSSAGEFTDLIAWDIVTASSTELMAWEEATKALTYGAATLRLWASDVEDYRTERARIQQRWDEEYSAAQSAVDDYSAGDSILGSGLSESLRVERLENLREELLGEHSGHWETLMERADQAKKDLRDGPGQATLERLVESGLLTGAQLGYFGDAVPSMVPDELTGDEDPAVVNLWWTSMTEEEQRQAMEDHADLLRELDGIPTTVRDQLNQEYLDDEIARLEEEITDQREELDEARESLGVPGGEVGVFSANSDLSELEERLDTLTALRDNLNDENADRYLLALDTEGDGRAIVANGNPDTADNVATLVPGTTTTWQSINGQINRGDALLEAATDASESGDHAVISWIGYDAPSVTEAAFAGRAEGAVDELSSFQDGLRATHENTSPSHNTVIGHSYGTTVVGHTAQSDGGLDADEIVMVGSPGANADHVSELGFAPENVHVSTAENDGITNFTGFTHGPDPTEPDFGATGFASDPGSEGGQFPLGDAHSEYFDRNSSSLEYMGQVIAGKH
ncbi:alpha/beta hydrolase [Nocardiopsis sp. FIRDI 009]|uniref:alpha/beta hydrolase n=1 Tax=Nocardiopsis sp. FIRDI 009 TaxID=714197 RepID=UPI000E25A542|nr:alpha/beta hydrolase [Nocardiopsis sp. FIRDI 009]